MRFDIMTLFPDLITTVLGESIIGRAQKSGAIEVHAHNIRDYSEDKHRRVDDTPYGGGMGMLMAAPPIYNCFKAVTDALPEGKRRVIYMSPRGSVFNHEKARELANYDNLVILCGHYEGVDARIIEEIVDEEISIGDYVLTGGEIPACIVTDAVARLLPGVLSDSECYEKESIASGLLEYPQYTRPYEFHGMTVPDVLISGHHENIDKWRLEQSLEITKTNRPDLYEAWERAHPKVEKKKAARRKGADE
ncbi:MAG: tRNA (guanosine(37)-N1)-methyltransferase TrmD [Clostridia bacterium]|nr:tRNA (guanosine(37)-N1)-methyltransferase TrmD [Clostridia bacterium]